MLYDFYNEKIDEVIINADAFEFWRKKIEINHPERLFLTREYLMRHSAQDVTEIAYPNKIAVNEYEYQLKYHFEPNHPRDGLTISIPLPHLNLVDDIHLDL